jgi:hypothetical protein
VAAALVLATGAAGAQAASGPSGAGPGAGCGAGPRAATVASYAQTSGSVFQRNLRFATSASDLSSVDVSGGTCALSAASVHKTGDTTSDEDSSFEGLNAAVLADSGGAVTLSGVSVSTDGEGANGVYATGSGSTLTMYGCSVSTVASGSHGADATGGATLKLYGVDITTLGESSSGVATDRGGGFVTEYGGEVTVSGARSAAFYSTGDITAYGVRAVSENDEGAVMDGSNELDLDHVSLTGDIGGVRLWNTLPFAMTSDGTAELSGGTLRVTDGDAFDAIGSLAVFDVSEHERVAETGELLSATDASTAVLNATQEALSGTVSADATSTAAVNLAGHSVWTGTAGSVALSLAGGSRWIVTGDSTLTSVTGLRISGGTVEGIVGEGHTVTYDASLAANAALGGKTYALPGGGSLEPAAS